MKDAEINVSEVTSSVIPNAIVILEPRYRSIHDCFIEIKTRDYGTCITEWYIRQLCKKKIVNCIPNGNMLMVDVNNVLRYLGYKEM